MNTGIALVSTMTEREFGMVFAKLAMQLRCTDADVVTIKSYYEALLDCPLDAITEAARGFAIELGRRWMPSTAEWHAAARAAQDEALRKTAPANVLEIICTACYDTGWVMAPGAHQMECPGNETCGRTRKHAPHTYTKACFCRATNPNYLRFQKFGRGSE